MVILSEFHNRRSLARRAWASPTELHHLVWSAPGCSGAPEWLSRSQLHCHLSACAQPANPMFAGAFANHGLDFGWSRRKCQLEHSETSLRVTLVMKVADEDLGPENPSSVLQDLERVGCPLKLEMHTGNQSRGSTNHTGSSNSVGGWSCISMRKHGSKPTVILQYQCPQFTAELPGCPGRILGWRWLLRKLRNCNLSWRSGCVTRSFWWPTAIGYTSPSDKNKPRKVVSWSCLQLWKVAVIF